MPSLYLSPSDYIAYGLPNTTTSMQVQQASALIDSYLRRPEGLVYNTDYLGQPTYMASPSPSQTFTSAETINAGNSIIVPLTVPIPAYADMIGEVVILDRATPTLTEACVISAMLPGQVILANVMQSHAAGCKLDFGLTILEERALPAKRSIARVMRPPLRLISGLGRYGYGRRTDQIAGMFNEVNLLAAIEAFGGPPMWVPFDVTQTGISEQTRELWIPAGILLAYYSEVRLRYVSGYPVSAIPSIIKQATAQLVGNFQSNPGLTGQISSFQAGTTKIARFTASMLDDDTRSMLDTYRIVLFV